MSDWTMLAVMISVSLPIGIALGIYLRYRLRSQATRFVRVCQSMSWQFYAAGTVFFLAFAISSIERFPFFIALCAFATFDLIMAVHGFLRERTRYSLLHLLLATTCAGIFAAFCHWFGMTMAVVAVVGAGGAVLVLFALEWNKHNHSRDH
ncbi:hypothetical protein [Lignipirellula cremea]|uniref:Uncharacterized protein n=1 Tax=Lignipirellula cremea TaxID=2528010 RepID=A0A518DPI7_9BACT|nr:hypothetical protein [Lignipirellula cremea]QDU93744.1 hypothetical protein Pla8534_15270 [Lignipirellula cremea]